jgi:serine/threonine protein kinase/WD40 repeat protein
MGEVYKARDSRLERTVAVKVLPSHLSSSAEIRQRFEREAKTISQLSHPHICALYDVGREGEAEFLVMEYLEGETLSDRLRKGALPLEQTLRYGIEIADALDKAHRQGIVHRDLKPGNVMLTKSGVKLLDFGLAKLAAPTSGVMSGLSVLPTTPKASNLTAEGTILGTLQYMAPEQLEGKEADARTDIFALGAVLYEMATGRKAFSGTSQASLIGAILKDEPAPIAAAAPTSPPALDRILRTCLAKDPEDRWQSAHDVGSELKWIASASTEAALPGPVVSRRRNHERLAWALFALAALSTIFLAVKGLRRAPGQVRTIRTSVVPPEKLFLNFVTISPDGSHVAFVAAAPGGPRQIWVRSLDDSTAQALAGTQNANFPFWSPDSRSIGFFADGKLKKIEASGGPAVGLCNAGPSGLGGTWSREGVILFALASAPISLVPDTGGVPRPVTRLDAARHETTHRYPWFLPDGRHFLYLAANLSGAPDDPANLIRIAAIDSKDDHALIPASSNAVYAPSSEGSSDGYIVFHRDGNLFAQQFDQARLQVKGPVLSVAQNVALDFLYWRHASFGAAENGSLAFESSTTVPSRLSWFDRSGRLLGAVGEPALFVSGLTGGAGRLRISPDGRQLAATIFEPATRGSDVWLYDLARGLRTRFTSGPSANADPVWSPDGLQIVFDSDRKHQGDLYRKPTSSGIEQPLLEGEGQRIADDWSSDGNFLALEIREPAGERRMTLSILSLQDGKITPFLRRGTTTGDARFSPDGRWLAYTSEESGRFEIYITPFPGPGQKWQVSTEGGTQPRWRRDGKELYYLSSDLHLMSVGIRNDGQSLEPSIPAVLFEPHPRPLFFDASADGQRFLIMSSGVEQSPPITLVQNWAADLRK